VKDPPYANVTKACTNIMYTISNFCMDEKERSTISYRNKNNPSFSTWREDKTFQDHIKCAQKYMRDLVLSLLCLAN
jgi:hypothetical protein